MFNNVYIFTALNAWNVNFENFFFLFLLFLSLLSHSLVPGWQFPFVYYFIGFYAQRPTWFMGIRENFQQLFHWNMVTFKNWCHLVIKSEAKKKSSFESTSRRFRREFLFIRLRFPLIHTYYTCILYTVQTKLFRILWREFFLLLLSLNISEWRTHYVDDCSKFSDR